MAKSYEVRIYNRSNQMINLHVRAPNSDFYANEQQIHLGPRDHVLLPKSHLNMDQVNNLCQKRILQVIYDSEAEEAKQQALAS